jgi:hypothetical protein
MSKVVEIFAEDNSIIERDATAEELKQRKVDAQAHADAKLAEEASKAESESAKAALLERLGITAEEAELLLG